MNEKMEYYKGLIGTDELISVVFTLQNDNGDWIGFVNDSVRVELSNKINEVTEMTLSGALGKNADIVGSEQNVKVYDVDDERETVFVYLRTESILKRIREVLRSRIYSRYKNKGKSHRHGIVKEFYNTGIIVDIEGIGIFGFLDRSAWRKGVTLFTLKKRCKIGDVIDFFVIKRNYKNNNEKYEWELSRSELTDDPWKTLPDGTFAQGKACIIECTHKSNTGITWVGVPFGLPNIDHDVEANGEVLGDYIVAIGEKYKCEVITFDRLEHKTSPLASTS